MGVGRLSLRTFDCRSVAEGLVACVSLALVVGVRRLDDRLRTGRSLSVALAREGRGRSVGVSTLPPILNRTRRDGFAWVGSCPVVLEDSVVLHRVVFGHSLWTGGGCPFTGGVSYAVFSLQV